MEIRKVAFTMYPVDDLNRARDFYENKLNLKPGKISAGGKWVEYDLPGGGCFCITDLAEGVKPSGDRGGSVAFEVDNVDTLLADLKSKKVRVKVETFQTPVCKIAVILDSEGNAVTLHQLTR